MYASTFVELIDSLEEYVLSVILIDESVDVLDISIGWLDISVGTLGISVA